VCLTASVRPPARWIVSGPTRPSPDRVGDRAGWRRWQGNLRLVAGVSEAAVWVNARAAAEGPNRKGLVSAPRRRLVIGIRADRVRDSRWSIMASRAAARGALSRRTLVRSKPPCTAANRARASRSGSASGGNPPERGHRVVDLRPDGPRYA
jgi:hypothetical protein